jgi:hypothetical protein
VPFYWASTNFLHFHFISLCNNGFVYAFLNKCCSVFVLTVSYTLHIQEHRTRTHLVNLDGHVTSPTPPSNNPFHCRCAGHYQTDQITIKFPSQNIQAWQEKNSWTHAVSIIHNDPIQWIIHEGQSTWTHIQLYPLQYAEGDSSNMWWTHFPHYIN